MSCPRAIPSRTQSRRSKSLGHMIQLGPPVGCSLRPSWKWQIRPFPLLSIGAERSHPTPTSETAAAAAAAAATAVACGALCATTEPRAHAQCQRRAPLGSAAALRWRLCEESARSLSRSAGVVFAARRYRGRVLILGQCANGGVLCAQPWPASSERALLLPGPGEQLRTEARAVLTIEQATRR